MDAGVIVAIVIGALLLLALLALLGRRGRTQRLETRREQSRELRRDAEVRTAEADRVSAEADQRAASARQEEALARQKAAEAEDVRRVAGERHAEADERDPDVKTGGLFRRGSRDHDREDRGAREEGQPVPASAPAGHDGASHNGEEGAVQERVHRERDPESGEIHDERIEERRFER